MVWVAEVLDDLLGWSLNAVASLCLSGDSLSESVLAFSSLLLSLSVWSRDIQ